MHISEYRRFKTLLAERLLPHCEVGRGECVETITVEHVVCVEEDEAFAIRVGDVATGLFDRAEIEGLGVSELDVEET